MDGFFRSKVVERYPVKYKILCVFLSFFLPFLVITLAILALHITPFGNHSLAIADAKYYLNNEMYFARLMRGEENIFYSFNCGLGANAWSQFAWGGFNFGSLLALFASLETIPSIFTWICIFNLSLCGLTMYLLLVYVNNHRTSNLIFSTSYAMIGFNVVNCYQVGFIIGPIVLPLLVLGLLRMFQGRNPFLYILSLAFCTFDNFYFAFHLCVFSLVYFIAYYYVKRKELRISRNRFIFSWAISSIIGGLLAAPMWLPALKALSGGGRLNQTSILEYSFHENMPFIKIFAKLFTGANSTAELVTGLPNIFCGILVVAMLIMYFFNKRIDNGHKRAVVVTLAFYLLTFYIPALTMIMHGGTHTNWFPYRYSYVFSFILTCVAVEEFCFISDLTIRETKICGAIMLGATILVFSTSYESISGGSVLLDLLLLFFMWLGFWFYKSRPNKAPLRTFSMFLLILVCINLYANFIISTAKVKDWELDLKEYNDNIMVSGSLVDALNGADNGFFRMEKEVSESGSVAADAYLYNYNGVSHSGPTERMFVHQGLQKLGINWFDMRHWYSEGVPAATDALLGLKYVLSSRDLNKEKGYEKRITLDETSIYQSSYYLPVATLVNGDVSEIELGDDVFLNLNKIWSSMTGSETPIFTEQEDVTFTLHNAAVDQSITSSELRTSSSQSEENNENDTLVGTFIEYSFTAEENGPVYIFDTSIPSSPNGLAAPAIKYCGYYEKGDEVTGNIDLKGADYSTADFLRGYCVNLVFAYADNNVLEEYADYLNNRDITFNVEHENDLNGIFTAESAQRILFTIPWDEGWICYVDGERISVDKTWDLFMSIEAPEGKHTYQLKFIPAWMNYGLYLCGAALIGLMIFIICWKKR